LILTEKTIYKYIVDGNWVASPHEPQESDNYGSYNNVYHAPPKPAPSTIYTVTSAAGTAAAKVEDVAKDAAATAGAPSFVSYVTSGLGAAIATVTGIDPINPPQVCLFSFSLIAPIFWLCFFFFLASCTHGYPCRSLWKNPRLPKVSNTTI
jgi:hypothetical protein